MDNLTLEVVNPAVIGGGSAVLLFFGILGALAFGRRLGRRALALYGSPPEQIIGSLETAVFTLLALLIAFTFSGGLSRFDVRRTQAVDEANAIGTAYLRIDLVPAAAQGQLRESFRKYTDSRIATYRKLPDISAAHSEFERSRELQAELWSRSVAAVRLPDARPQAELLFIEAVNEMINFTTIRAAATMMHPPIIIYLMLFGCALAAALLAGYQSASEKAYNWLHQVGFAGIVALTFYVIIDIEYPRLGFVRIDAIDKVLVDVRNGMK